MLRGHYSATAAVCRRRAGRLHEGCWEQCSGRRYQTENQKKGGKVVGATRTFFGSSGTWCAVERDSEYESSETETPVRL